MTWPAPAHVQEFTMADTDGDATASRCKQNADQSTSVNDTNQLLQYYKQWSNKYDEVNT